MRTVTATAIVRPDHVLTVQVPADIAPGTHQVVVVLQEAAPVAPFPDFLANWPAPYDVGPVDPNMTYRREDMYGDDGR